MATVWTNIPIAIAIQGWITRLRYPVLFLLLLYSAAQVVWAEDTPNSKEYFVKAAFLYNFTKFVEWMPDRFAANDSPIVVGILGKNLFGGELDRIVQTRKVNGRGFVVKVISSATELSPLHLLFVPLGEESRLTEKTMDLIHSRGILTVGESDQFAALGGIINFITDVDKVHFQINREAADHAGVKISAQLLKLAVLNRKKD